MTLVSPSAAEAATKYSRYVDAARFQLSALRIIDLRNFFAKRKEVTDKESIPAQATIVQWTCKPMW